LKNILVPKHRVLSEEEAEELLKRYNVTKDMLPKIKINDPGLQGLNAKVGDIIEITRKEPEVGTVLYYRVVVDEKHFALISREFEEEEEEKSAEEEEDLILGSEDVI